MQKIFSTLKSSFVYVATVIFIGVPFALFLILQVISTLPIILYRWAVINILAPCFAGRNLRKPPNTLGNCLSGDLVQSIANGTPPRGTILVNFIMAGDIHYNQLADRVDQKWIRFRSEDGKLKYPEFQQYLVHWMGYAFWKQEDNFQLEDHLIVHKIEENASDEQAEGFLVNLTEKLLNCSWTAKRSPWEIHLVQNYKNSTKGEKLSILLFRTHHAMGDGFAILHVMIEQLFGKSLEPNQVARPATVKVNPFLKIGLFLTYPIRVSYILGKLTLVMAKKPSPFHIPDSKKSGTQLYGRGPAIPLRKIKQIKNKFGVSFGAVMDSVLATALGNMLRKKLPNGAAMPTHIAYGIAVPVPGHPRKLTNHATGIVFDAPITVNMCPQKRLQEIDRNAVEIKRSPLPGILFPISQIFGSYPAKVAQFIARNRYLATGVSSFPGPSVKVNWNEWEAVGIDAIAGIMPGVGGVGFYAVSYAENIQVTVTAEQAVLSKQDINEMLADVQTQFDILYELTNCPENEFQTLIVSK